MSPDKEIVGTAIRVEKEESTGKMYLVFEITNEKYKQNITKTWIEEIEFIIIDKDLVKE